MRRRLHVVDRFPLIDEDAAVGSLLAPLPGTVVRVEVVVGETVAAGDVLVVLEAMKMEHTMRAPHDGVDRGAARGPGTRSRPATSSWSWRPTRDGTA